MPSPSVQLRRDYKTRPSAETVISDPGPSALLAPHVCAKLSTIGYTNRREAILLSLDKQVRIGRDARKCTYVISQDHVSAVHCQIVVVKSPNGGIIISCQDMSRNGIIWNGHRIKKTSVILGDGDNIEIPHSLKFTCHHIWKDTAKQSIFDPAPNRGITQKKIAGYIVTSQCLGSGSFATVHLALDVPNCRQVACKTIRTRKESELREVGKEINLLMGLTHPNINQIYDSHSNGKFIHIFLQLCTGGDLFTYIVSNAEKHRRLCESEAKYLGYQLLLGLKYLHNHAISHRDLKARHLPVQLSNALNVKLIFHQPENILLYTPGSYPRIVIADFGLARPNAHEFTFNVCGTVSYLPPEGIKALHDKELAYVGMPADCWSVGLIIYIMLTNTHPFDNFQPSMGSSWFRHVQDSYAYATSASEHSPNYLRTENLLKQKIVEGQVDFRQSFWCNMLDAKLLISQLLVRDYTQRATVHDALQSPWIISELELLENIYETRILKA